MRRDQPLKIHSVIKAIRTQEKSVKINLCRLYMKHSLAVKHLLRRNGCISVVTGETHGLLTCTHSASPSHLRGSFKADSMAITLY